MRLNSRSSLKLPIYLVGLFVVITYFLLQDHRSIPVYTYKIIKTYYHQKTNFTEGLVLDHGTLFEGTGLYGQSKIIKTRLAQDKIVAEYKMPSRYFGEGIAIFGNKLYQLTYRSHLGFVYDKNSFKLIGNFPIKTEGWGLTRVGKYLVMSNGTADLLFLNPQTFKVVKTLHVIANGKSIDNLNALAFADGVVYANIWYSDIIAEISARTGGVVAWINMAGLDPEPQHLHGDNILNGIAYDAVTKHFLVTGKCWPYIYEVKFIPKSK